MRLSPLSVHTTHAHWHDSARSPLFKLGAKTSRPPIRGTDIVHESVFSPPQVAWRRKVTPKVQDELDKFPHAEPLPLEVQAKESWPPF